MNLVHPLTTTQERPSKLNNPFRYTPHPLCQLAAKEVTAWVEAHDDWTAEVAAGKMFGVLVCEIPVTGELGFLAAYSGQIGGREDWPWFVPAVFDYLQNDGYFKREEQSITDINREISIKESQPSLQLAKSHFQALRQQAEAALADYKKMMAEAKAHRDARRGLVDEVELIRESQYQKAEYHRLKMRWKQTIEEAEAQVLVQEEAIEQLKKERKRRSDVLQRWLFDQFHMLNAQGDERTLTEIFAPTPQRVPPAGSGECCAPKLLQYAFAHGLKPLCMAEFWMGRSPRMEVRHHGQYYPACRGKCKPILEWMLKGMELEDDSPKTALPKLDIVFEDNHIIVVDKPSGLLSVPGKTDDPSVQSILSTNHSEVYMVHRLDQDTSGLLVVALTKEAYHHLQQQFLHRTVRKKYIALLEGIVEGSGTIILPLRPDLTDRPRQVVDHEHGRQAVTDYCVLSSSNGRTRISLTPHTGRTHQLRMHCAHEQGLGTPIVGDALYGHSIEDNPQRLCLHAASLEFVHPATETSMNFSSECPF